VSVDNFDGDGFADQSSIIYSFQNDDGEQIRELSRSGFGEAGPSPGDVIERETTNSELTGLLCELENATDDLNMARSTLSTGTNYLYIPSIRITQVQQKLKNQRRKKPHHNEHLTWPVTARCGSRMCGFFCKRNKRLASLSGYAGCRVPLAGRS